MNSPKNKFINIRIGKIEKNRFFVFLFSSDISFAKVRGNPN